MNHLILPLLAQSAPYAYNRPFIQPAPIWDYWYLLLLPLVIAIAVVYKATKVSRVKDLPRAAGSMTFWILAALIGAAAGLLLLVRITQ